MLLDLTDQTIEHEAVYMCSLQDLFMKHARAKTVTLQSHFRCATSTPRSGMHLSVSSI